MPACEIYNTSELVTVFFTTNAASGAAVAPSTAFEAADVILYKNNSATQRTSTSGWTMVSPFDSLTGQHLITFDLTDNTDAGFYAAGSRYQPVLSPDTETVDSQTVIADLDRFKIGAVDANVTQWLGTAPSTPTVAGVPNVNAKTWNDLTTVKLPLAPATAGRDLVVDAAGLADSNMVKAGPTGNGVAQTGGDIYASVQNIGATAAPQNANAASRTITTGTEGNALAQASTLDGQFHNMTDVAGTLDFYYEFDLSAITNAFVTSAAWNGYVVGVVNTVKVYAYNWGTVSYDQIGSIAGIAGTVVSVDEWDLTSAHIGTGGNLGKIRIRFAATGLTSATVKTDRILLGYGVTPNTTTPPTTTQIAGAILLDTTKKLYCDATGQVRTTLPILINTALNNYEFPMVLSSDHVSPADGKTVTVQRSIDGGAWTACTNSPTTSQPTGTNGTYKINFSAADRNGTVIRFRATAAGCDPTEWLLLTQA